MKLLEIDFGERLVAGLDTIVGRNGVKLSGGQKQRLIIGAAVLKNPKFMIIDEAQNLTPLEVKTIITRVGSGTKIVFTGDPYQIDNPYVDSSSNGFNYIVSKFREQAIAAHIELQKGERSELAELAANIL